MACVIGRSEPMSYGDLMRLGSILPPDKLEAWMTERSQWTKGLDGKALPPIDFDRIVENRGLVFACGPGVENQVLCKHCDVFASVLCDAPLGEGLTCDVALCREHRLRIGRDLDLCPIHSAEWQADTGGVGVVVLERLR